MKRPRSSHPSDDEWQAWQNALASQNAPFACMTVAEARELLNHPTFGTEEHIHAKKLIELAAEVEAMREERGWYRVLWNDLEDLTMSYLREERKIWIARREREAKS